MLYLPNILYNRKYYLSIKKYIKVRLDQLSKKQVELVDELHGNGFIHIQS